MPAIRAAFGPHKKQEDERSLSASTHFAYTHHALDLPMGTISHSVQSMLCKTGLNIPLLFNLFFCIPVENQFVTKARGASQIVLRGFRNV